MRTFTIAIFLMTILFIRAYSQNVEITGTTTDFNLDLSKSDDKEVLPVIDWENPVDKTITVKSRSFQLKLNINSNSNLKTIEVYINDYPLSMQRGFSIVKSSDVYSYNRSIDSEILLRPGDNKLMVTAKNEDGGMVSSIRNITLDVNELVEKATNRTDYALLFASDDYDEWGRLINPIQDAEAIADELKNTYGFQIELVKNPTKKEVLQTLRKYSKKSFLPNDQLFIFFAGHGNYDNLFNQGYIVCKDTKKNDEEKISYISYSNLREIVNNMSNEHIFLAIDACFGGAFDPLISSSNLRGDGDGLYRELDHYEYINRKLKFKTRMFLTSGGKEYVPDGKPGSHSPFVRKFLEALRTDGGSDGILTLGELKAFLEKINPEPRYGEFGNNEPGSDFIFVAE